MAKRILIIDPFLGGSHKKWAEGLAKYSRFKVDILGLSAHHWKWRMQAAAITMVRRLADLSYIPDLILATDMLDLATFKGLIPKRFKNVPIVLYMHENQLTHPIPEGQMLDNNYPIKNFSSCLAADAVWFNSSYHKNSFLEALPAFLEQFPSPNEKGQITNIQKKSKVMPLGLELAKLESYKRGEKDADRATILWNHRWEYDKNPERFFGVLLQLKQRGIEFKLVVLGENYERKPTIFEQVPELFKEELLHFGYAENKEEYYNWLWYCDILPVTSHHDFFGISVVEAIACNIKPLLPYNLAYPEHLPSAYKASFFYEDDDLLTNQLQRMIMNVRILRKQDVQQYVMKYDWSEMIVQYDCELERIINEYGK